MLKSFISDLQLSKKRTSSFINLSAAEIERLEICNLPYKLGLQDHYIHGNLSNFFNDSRTTPISNVYKDLAVSGYQMIQNITNFEFCDLRTSSALHALQICILAVTKQNDVIVYPHNQNGGHSSYYKIIQSLGRIPIPLAFDSNWEPEIPSGIKPDMIVLGFSETLSSSILCEKFRSKYANCITILDYAQLSGFLFNESINNSFFKNEIVIGSTHKTLPLSPLGFILTNNKELFSQIDKLVFPTFIRSVNIINQFSVFLGLKVYSKIASTYLQNIHNIRIKLSDLLVADGLDIVKHPTENNSSHQIWIVTKSNKDAMKRLYQSNIITDSKNLPYNIGAGLRIGVQQLAADDVQEEYLKDISKAISSAILYKRVSLKVTIDKSKGNSIWNMEKKLIKNLNVEI